MCIRDSSNTQYDLKIFLQKKWMESSGYRVNGWHGQSRMYYLYYIESNNKKSDISIFLRKHWTHFQIHNLSKTHLEKPKVPSNSNSHADTTFKFPIYHERISTNSCVEKININTKYLLKAITKLGKILQFNFKQISGIEWNKKSKA